MGRLSFCHSFRGIFYERVGSSCSMMVISLSQRKYPIDGSDLVFHIRAGGIGGGTVGLAHFDKNLAGMRPQDPQTY